MTDWTPFQRASLKMPTVAQAALEYGISEAQARRVLEDMKQDVVWLNNRYQVNIRSGGTLGGAEIVHLSIKRLDKEAVHDWRDFQRIKNELVGEECDGLELYPAESRRIDAANQYHLWVVKDPKVRLPVGFFGERVVSPDSVGHSKQRPL